LNCLVSGLLKQFRRYLPAVFFIITMAESLSADTALHYRIQPLFSVQKRNLNEYVFAEDNTGTYRKLSCLEWNNGMSFSIGAKLEVSWHGFFVSVHDIEALRGRHGAMYDSDWLELDEVKNSYSVSDNSLRSSFTLGVETGYEFPSGYFSFTPFTAFDYDYLSMKASDGYGWYGGTAYSRTTENVPYDSKDAKYFRQGELRSIDYAVLMYTLWTGLDISFRPFSSIELGIRGAVSPYLFIDAYDCHEGGYRYHDQIQGFFSAYRYSVSAAYHFCRNWSVKMEYSWGICRTVYGTDSCSETGKGTRGNTGTQSGFSSAVKALSVGIEWKK